MACSAIAVATRTGPDPAIRALAHYRPYLSSIVSRIHSKVSTAFKTAFPAGDCSDDATSLETIIRRRALGLIDAIVEEELEAAGSGALGAGRSGAAARGRCYAQSAAVFRLMPTRFGELQPRVILTARFRVGMRRPERSLKDRERAR